MTGPSTVLLPLLLLSAIYAQRLLSLRRQRHSGASLTRAAAFAAAMTTFAAALAPPVEPLAERSFTMHMVQHLLLADIGPLLLLLALSRAILRPLTRRIASLERALGPLAHPVTGLLLWLTTMYLWHTPMLYQAALHSEQTHALEHISFVTAGVAFWWPLLQPIPMRRRLEGLGPIGYVSAAKLGLGLLGLYLVWAPSVIYPYYESVPGIWGLSPRDDQTAGGMIMMIEQSIVLAVAFAILFVAMLAKSEREELALTRRASRL